MSLLLLLIYIIFLSLCRALLPLFFISFFLSLSLFFLTPRLLEVCGRSCPALPATTKSSIMTSSLPSLLQGAAQNYQFAIHFHFSTSWSCHLKLTVFFLSKRQEFNLWKIGSPIIFLYRPAPFACSWCFPSVNKVNISNLLYRSNNGHRHIWLRKNKPTTIYNFLLMYTSGRQENMSFFVYLSFEGRPAIGWEIPPFCLCIRV